MKNKWSVVGGYACRVKHGFYIFDIVVYQGNIDTAVWLWEINATTFLVSVKTAGHANSLVGAKARALEMVPKMEPFCKECHRKIKKEKAMCKGKWRNRYQGLIFFYYS